MKCFHKLTAKITFDLNDEYPRLTYEKSIPHANIRNIKYDHHFGQWKLFFTEIQHLSHCLKSRFQYAIVIYVGAASSNKLWIIHLIFPNVKFLVIDPAEFIIRKPLSHGKFLTHTQDPEGIFHYSVGKIKPGDKIHMRETPKATSPNDNNPFHNNAHWMNIIDDFYNKDDKFIYINQKFFSKKDAEFVKFLIDQKKENINYCDAPVIFWSDVRSCDEETTDPTDEAVARDTLNNYIWTKIIEPDFAMFKFRTLYGPPANIECDDFESISQIIPPMAENGDVLFFKSILYNQPWRPVNSTEVRAWVTGDDIKNNNLLLYPNTVFEQQNCYFNKKIRKFKRHEKKFHHESVDFCECADCAIEIQIWLDICSKFELDPNTTIPKYRLMLECVTNRSLGSRMLKNRKTTHGTFLESN